MRAGGIALLLVLVSAANPAYAKAPKSCHAPGAAFKHGPVRLYSRGFPIRTLYLCSAHFRTPVAFFTRRVTGGDSAPDEFRLRHGRLAFNDWIVATQHALLGSVDLRTARYVRTEAPGQPWDNQWTVGPHGGIAFAIVELAVEQRLYYAAPGAHSFTPARVLVRLRNGDINDGSLWVGKRLLHWRGFDGGKRAALLNGPPQTVGPPLTCDSPRRQFHQGATTTFVREAAGMVREYVCSAHLRRPHRFWNENQIGAPSFYGFKRRGPRLAFGITYESEDVVFYLGWVDLRTGRSQYTSFYDYYDESELGPDGGIAVRSGRRIFYAPRAGDGIGGFRRLATAGNTIARGSLSVHGGRVWWRTVAGKQGSAAVKARKL